MRKARGGAVKSKNSADGRNKAALAQEPPKLILKSGSGWILENYQFMKNCPIEKQLDGIYKIYGIPLQYKTDPSHCAVHVFAEFQLNSFTFSLQMPDPSRALMVLMILSDFLINVSSFQNCFEGFMQWSEKTTKIIQNGAFPVNEQQLILTYINTALKPNLEMLHFVLTNEALQKLDSQGVRLFKPNAPTENESNEDQINVPDPNEELEAQLAAAAMAEKNAAEAEERRIQLQQAIEDMVTENMNQIKAAMDQRNEQIVQQLYTIDEKVLKSSKQHS